MMDSPLKKGPSTITQQDLTEMTIEELYDLNFPFLLKQRSRQPLTEQEQQLHSAIIAEANRRERALRVADRRERDERLINRYHQ